jgi:predicted PurR-regulated permease PerM
MLKGVINLGSTSAVFPNCYEEDSLSLFHGLIKRERDESSRLYSYFLSLLLTLPFFLPFFFIILPNTSRSSSSLSSESEEDEEDSLLEPSEESSEGLRGWRVFRSYFAP